MKTNYLQQLKSIVFEFLRDEPVKVILFGSRARGTASEISDYDIGVLPYSRYNHSKLTLLRDRLEEMNIPFTVDLVDLSESSEDFKSHALEGAQIWKN